MRLHVLLIVLVGLLLAADAPKGDAAKEMKKLEGTWQVVALTVDGKQVPEAELKKLQVVITGNKYRLTMADKTVDEGTLTVDPNQKPKTIDTTSSQGANKDQKSLGIYELDGDTLKMCFAPNGKKEERPKKFASKRGSGQELGLYKRVKP